MYRRGLVPVAFGLESKQDWVHITNLVQAYNLVADSLMSAKSKAVSHNPSLLKIEILWSLFPFRIDMIHLSR